MAGAFFSRTQLRSNNAYSKIEQEDAEELVHRRAKFLIYKAMNQIEKRNKPSRIRVKITKLRVKIGRRLKKLRKSLLTNVVAARACIVRQLKLLGCSSKNCLDLPRPLAVI